jgi:2-oxoglutarate dehydrogenase E1 component
MAVTQTVEVTMPAMGESVSDGTILEWHKKVGDTVAEDETIVEISTDKVDAEVPSPASGTVVKVHAEEGDTVTVGQVLAEIEVGGGSSNTQPPAAAGTGGSNGNGSVAAPPKPEAEAEAEAEAEVEVEAEAEPMEGRQPGVRERRVIQTPCWVQRARTTRVPAAARTSGTRRTGYGTSGERSAVKTDRSSRRISIQSTR